jgi:hypothetical protein
MLFAPVLRAGIMGRENLNDFHGLWPALKPSRATSDHRGRARRPAGSVKRAPRGAVTDAAIRRVDASLCLSRNAPISIAGKRPHTLIVRAVDRDVWSSTFSAPTIGCDPCPRESSCFEGPPSAEPSSFEVPLHESTS